MPPMSTKSTSCRLRCSTISFGRSSACSCDATVAQSEVGEGDHAVDSLVGRERKLLPVEGPVVPVVDRLRRELKLLAHQVEPARERRDRGRDEVALDPRNRGLRGARAGGELALRQAVATSGRAEELSRGHAPYDISSDIKTDRREALARRCLRSR